MPWTDEDYELHGYRYVRCSKCGWRGMTDSDTPECGCGDPGIPEDPEFNDCRCGACEWEDEEYPICAKCNTGPLTDGKTHSRVVTALKIYNEGHNEIRPGDRYRRKARRDYYPNGPWGKWIITRTRITKGHNWADQHTVEPKPVGWDWEQGKPLG